MKLKLIAFAVIVFLMNTSAQENPSKMAKSENKDKTKKKEAKVTESKPVLTRGASGETKAVSTDSGTPELKRSEQKK